MPHDGAVISTSSPNFLEFEPTRHQRWYERIFLSTPLGYVFSMAMVLLTPFYIAYGHWDPLADPNQLMTMFILGCGFIVNGLLSRALTQYPGGNLIAYQLAITTATIGAILLAITISRVGYSNKPLFIGFALLVGIQVAAVRLKARFRYTKFALVPSGRLREPRDCPEVARFFTLKNTQYRRRFDALVVDMDAPLSDEWVRFIALHNSRNIPVLSGKYLNESIYGSVDLKTLSSSDLRCLQPNPLFLLGKRMLDLACALMLLPVALPLLALVALAIRLESPGPALFIQPRVGAGNKTFAMLKFRSMRLPKDGEDNEPRFADEEEHRITRLGRLLRRSRLDELPQLWNVIVGDMSLIGPRPEQPAFAKDFERAVPYYSYRHIIKPGITGWAQVQQGYASGVVDTYKKVQHDFYYIKHLSPVLDILIIMKTIHTVFTGFGAR